MSRIHSCWHQYWSARCVVVALITADEWWRMQLAVVIDDVARWPPMTSQWWRQSRWRVVGWDATKHCVALYMCTARPREHHLCVAWVRKPTPYEWRTLGWEHRMLGPRHRCSSFPNLELLLFQLYADATVDLSARRSLYDVQYNETNLWSGPEDQFMYWLWYIRQIFDALVQR